MVREHANGGVIVRQGAFGPSQLPARGGPVQAQATPGARIHRVGRGRFDQLAVDLDEQLEGELGGGQGLRHPRLGHGLARQLALGLAEMLVHVGAPVAAAAVAGVATQERGHQTPLAALLPARHQLPGHRRNLQQGILELGLLLAHALGELGHLLAAEHRDRLDLAHVELAGVRAARLGGALAPAARSGPRGRPQALG